MLEGVKRGSTPYTYPFGVSGVRGQVLGVFFLMGYGVKGKGSGIRC